MAKQYTWDKGVKVKEEDIPDPPTPQPRYMDKTSFLAWYDATFDLAVATRAQIADNWPTG